MGRKGAGRKGSRAPQQTSVNAVENTMADVVRSLVDQAHAPPSTAVVDRQRVVPVFAPEELEELIASSARLYESPVPSEQARSQLAALTKLPYQGHSLDGRVQPKQAGASTFDDLMEAASALVAEGHYPLGKVLYGKAVEFTHRYIPGLKPGALNEAGAALCGLSQCRLKMGEVEGAIASANEALINAPQSVLGYKRMIHALYAQGPVAWPKARVCCEVGLELPTVRTNPDAFLSDGVVASIVADHSIAQMPTKSFNELVADVVPAITDRNMINTVQLVLEVHGQEVALGALVPAEAKLRALTNPKYFQVPSMSLPASCKWQDWNAVAKELHDGGCFCVATPLYGRALELLFFNFSGPDPEDPQYKKLARSRASILANRSGCYLAWKKVKEAADDAKAAMQECPTWYRGYFCYMRVLLMVKRKEEARAMHQHCLALCKNDDERAKVEKGVGKQLEGPFDSAETVHKKQCQDLD